jgi:hypothetical protein
MVNLMEHILEGEEYFLNALNIASESLEFLRTDIATLQSAAFLDGRTEVSIDNKTYTVSLADAMSWYATRGAAWSMSRLIFHISFCGSTLLSRALDTSDSVLVYKEPQVLSSLEEMKRHSDTGDIGGYSWKQILGLVLSQFNSADRTSRVRVVKPSNLLNSIVRDICELNDQNRAVFLDMDPRSFLIAVLRGGSARVAFVFQILENLQSTYPGYDHTVHRLSLGIEDEMTVVARKILLAHEMQTRIFADVMSSLPEHRYVRLSYEQLVASPQRHVSRIASRLDLGLSPDQIGRNIDSSFGRHSKADGLPFDLRSAAEVDAQVVDLYSHIVDDAMDWYRQQGFSA